VANKSIEQLRLIGYAEGTSLLVLLCIAMPLKYFAGKPEAVKVVGWIHGFLFVLFVLVAFICFIKNKWPFKRFVVACIAAFLPLGTFVFDAQLKKEQSE
jgi:integral membrane protein